jgi:hypothetical protein
MLHCGRELACVSMFFMRFTPRLVN